ncbi:MAG: hypothetical protein WC731_02760 [Candidatus Omnitrophota bacterium]|jgi:hypothetical protein
MFNYFERIIRIIYLEWKGSPCFIEKEHPNEETLVSFLEDKLPKLDRDLIQEHLLKCDICAEYLGTQLKIEAHLSKDVPLVLLERVRKMIDSDVKDNILEIFLMLKEKTLEIIQTSGDVLVGQELIPAPVLRSRQINEFKEEVSILKDLKEFRVLVKVENKGDKIFNLAVTIKDKQGRQIDKTLRITLIKDGIELESYVSDTGNIFFENILPDNYKVEVSQGSRILAVINLKVKA